MKLTLPDNSVRELPKGSSGYDLANSIEKDSSVSIITIDSEAGLEIMRHTLTAQVLARALKNIYPKSSLAIGPTIDDGFYYDIETDESISIDDLNRIEDEMHLSLIHI